MEAPYMSFPNVISHIPITYLIAPFVTSYGLIKFRMGHHCFVAEIAFIIIVVTVIKINLVILLITEFSLNQDENASILAFRNHFLTSVYLIDLS